uniref:Complement component 4 n=1 Tax=Cyprinus carpio TaxID=7962 RepID=A0A8C1XJT0_CYPCA
MICPLCFVVFVFLTVDAHRPTCLIVAPNVIHVGVEETVSVQLHGATKETSMQLYFQEQISRIIVSEKKSIILNKDNNYQAVVKLKVCFKKDEKYVQLAATSNDVFWNTVGSARKASIYLSTKRGYIFIQTDKPIYNPGENVKYRIFTLDNFMLPIKDEIHVQIINCKGFIVYNHILISDQILEKTITIPEVEEGKWKIIASYHKYPESTTSLEFEVKEYVLPTFEVTIEAPQPYHILKSQSFPFNISARYTYGKGVNGIAYIRFGLIDEKGNKIYLPGTEKQITDGTAKTEVHTEDLKTASENNTQGRIEGYYLYIAVSVLEKASGNLEEAESSSVKIVTSPYVVDLSKTKTYFTPGGVFSVLATATYPDGKRVPNLKFTATVTIEGSPEHILKNEGWGNDMGDVAMPFQIPPQAKKLAVTVRYHMIIILLYHYFHSNYLSLEVEHQVLQPGEALKATLRDITPQSAAKPTFIYFMVWSKGQIVQIGRVPRTEITTVNVNVNVEMVPSFRLVAYYFTDSSPNEKIVADSVWVDVKDICKGKVQLRQIIFQNLNLTVRTDPKAKVALAAVDSAVYILNKNKLGLQKMFEYMNSYDLACSIGGGEDSSAVLQRAGLTFMCNCDMETPTPLGNITPDILFYELFFRNHFNNVVNSFKGSDRKCCLDGVRPNKMHTSCDERLKRVEASKSCRKAFKMCCEAANERRRRETFEKRKTYLGRVADDTLDEIVINEDAIYLRKYFPQSWMWTVIQTDIAPDSITTWEIQAVGISPTKGFCIAEPKPLRVFQDFFLSVNLPYSVKRNEQLQVKAVVYNYKEESLKIIVKMDKKEGLCTAGGSDLKEEVVVPGNSAVAVYFTVVPLVIGNIPINVLAYASDTVNDRVEKELRVEVKCGKGLVHPKMKILSLIPHAVPKQGSIPADEIPGGVDSEISLSLKGGVMGESVNNCLNLEGINKLINLPTGCAEQTMVKMSPAIHAMRYLDATNQWISLKAERRDEAQSMIQTGYNTVLTYKKVDGSYGAFLRTPSSIWLTAFIAKELTESRDIISVKDSYIQESMSYLISKQKSNAAWDDPNQLYDRGMKGGVGKAKDDVPLTAFILISMNHLQNMLSIYSLLNKHTFVYLQRVAMDRAKSYLEGQLDALESPYSLAITAYALSLHDQQSANAQRAHRKLKNICFWNSSGGRGESAGKANAESVETTAYALLSALSLRDKAYAKLTANWLTEQRKYGGGFQSTQSICSSLEIYNTNETFDDYYNYEGDEDQKDEPMSSIEWFDLRSRRKRQISEEPKKESSVIYTVCFFFTAEFKKCYEVVKLITDTECLQFGAEQVVPMGLVQPASAVIYDYYSPEKRCGIFYTAPHKSPMISKLCNGDVCTCAEGGCPRNKVTFSKDIKDKTRSRYACYSPGVDYAYVIKVLNSSTDHVFMYYTTLITDVLQTGLLDSGIQKHATRQMILRLSCDELELKKEVHYLIMGQNDAISVLNNDGQQYVLNNDMWIEKMPEEKNCKATKNRAACHLLNEFIKQHPITRCDI